MTTKQMWPSETATRVRSSTYRQSGQKIPTDNKSGVLVMLFVLLLIAGVLAGLWFFVVEDLVSQLQTVRDALSPTQLATTGGR